MINAALAVAAALGGLVILIFPAETEAKILIFTMTVLAWTFVVTYALRSPWRSTQAGRSVMATTVSIALIGTQLASVWWFGDYPGRSEVRSMVILALVLTLLHRLLVLRRIQHADADDGPGSTAL
ncbi:hypothetical protein F1734_17390 [Rhodococcus ruber]|uniref:putative phage holin n=1 Tax=Rhodococcus ruber TaxID=1830 RepID=UPI0007441CB9|nr:hypothetical protein [Rhodococcus ruber]QRE81841.1 hypothetical protein F1734_17390 [Rhodococcus ruber]